MYEFQFNLVSHFPTGQTRPQKPPSLRLTAFSKTGIETTYVEMTGWRKIPIARSEAIRAVEDVFGALNAKMERLRKRSKLVSVSPVRSWSYLDFLYFSTVTQTTLGYGDILPNSTTVRMVVTIQIVVGLAVLGVLINIVLRRRTNN
jgi:hypothetical protein